MVRRFERQIGQFIHVIVTPTRVEIQDIHGGCVVVNHATGQEIANAIVDGIETVDNPFPSFGEGSTRYEHG